MLECVPISYSRRSSPPRDRTCISRVSYIAGRFFTHWAIANVLKCLPPLNFWPLYGWNPRGRERRLPTLEAISNSDLATHIWDHFQAQRLPGLGQEETSSVSYHSSGFLALSVGKETYPAASTWAFVFIQAKNPSKLKKPDEYPAENPFSFFSALRYLQITLQVGKLKFSPGLPLSYLYLAPTLGQSITSSRVRIAMKEMEMS